jgi:CubicO group peptidase (beta-lactamase class C family)
MTGPVVPASIGGVTDPLAAALARIDDWGADHAVAAVVGPDGVMARHGDGSHRFAWASVTKLVTAWAVHVAVERGVLALDDAAGPPGATVRHLLAHASGLPFEGEAPISAPGRRRIYSNPGYDALGRLLAERAKRSIEDVLHDEILRPLGMTSCVLVDRPSQGLHGSIDDLVVFARELLRPGLISAATAAAAVRVAFPGLPGVVPGVGNFDPCDWGLGPELHAGKRPHWMADRNSAAAFGHFGGTGTFLWVDPAVGVALVVLTDRAFGPWALEAWPALSDEVLAVLA